MRDLTQGRDGGMTLADFDMGLGGADVKRRKRSSFDVMCVSRRASWAVKRPFLAGGAQHCS